MKILIIDDDPGRHELLHQRFGDAHEYQSVRVPAGVSADHFAWADVVCLDHDMCEGCLVALSTFIATCPRPDRRGGCDCPTGLHVARRLAASEYRPRVIVHSANIPGGMRIARVLVDAGFSVQHVPVSRWHWGPGCAPRLEESHG